MIVRVDKSFQKDTTKINQEPLKKEIINIIRKIQEAKQLTEISNCKKIRGGKNLYRIRVKDYRIGMVKKGKQVHLIRFLHRKDIYKYFP